MWAERHGGGPFDGAYEGWPEPSGDKAAQVVVDGNKLHMIGVAELEPGSGVTRLNYAGQPRAAWSGVNGQAGTDPRGWITTILTAGKADQRCLAPSITVQVIAYGTAQCYSIASSNSATVIMACALNSAVLSVLALEEPNFGRPVRVIQSWGTDGCPEALLAAE